MHDPHDTESLTGLTGSPFGRRGQDTVISVSRGEIAVINAMVDALRPGEHGNAARNLLRVLDMRHGAASSLRPDLNTIEVTVPMTGSEVEILRRVAHRSLTRPRNRGQSAAADLAAELMRELDRRIGAAQMDAAGVALEDESGGTDWPVHDLVNRLAAATRIPGTGHDDGAAGEEVVVHLGAGDLGDLGVDDIPIPAPSPQAEAARGRVFVTSVMIVAGMVLVGLLCVLVARSWDADRDLAAAIVCTVGVIAVAALSRGGGRRGGS